MKRENFITLVLGVVGGMLFALGMCMCLLPEWNAFVPGAVCTALGIIALAALLIARRRMLGKAPLRIAPRTIGRVAYGIAAALVLGLGMCMIMVWNLMIWGIIVGVIGILMLLGLIPLCIGLK